MLLDFESANPNDANLQTRAPTVLGVIIPLHVLALVVVSARILVKTKLGKLGADDLFIGIALLTAISLVVLTVIECKYGFGMHTRDMRPEWVVPYGIVSYASIALGSVYFYFTKASMLFFYLRLATERRFRTICYICIAITTSSTAAVLFVNLFGCTPISGNWDRRPSNPSVCITRPSFYYYSGISNILIDLLLMVLPIPILLKMKLKWRVKLGLVMMFSMGFLITAASIISLRMMHISINSKDIIWDGAFSWMSSLVENTIGILTACMPSMRMFVKWIRKDKGSGAGAGQVEDEETIGGGGGKRRQKKNGVLTESDDGSKGSGTYELGNRVEGVVGGVVGYSTEVLLEAGVVEAENRSESVA